MLMSRLSTDARTTECEDRARILKQNSQYKICDMIMYNMLLRSIYMLTCTLYMCVLNRQPRGTRLNQLDVQSDKTTNG